MEQWTYKYNMGGKSITHYSNTATEYPINKKKKNLSVNMIEILI